MNRNNWLFGLTILTISSIIKSKSILDEDFENLEKIKNEELETELDFLEALKNSSVQDNDRLIKFKSFLADEFMKISKDIGKFDFDEEAIITTAATPTTQTDEEAIVTTIAPTTPTDKFDYENVEIKVLDSMLNYTVKEDKIEFVMTGDNKWRTALFNLDCNEYVIQLVKIRDPGSIEIGYADENYPLKYYLGYKATSVAYHTKRSDAYSSGYDSYFYYDYGTRKYTDMDKHMKQGDQIRIYKQEKSLKYYINDLLVQEHTIQTDVELKPAVAVNYSGTEFNIQFLC